MYGNFAFGFKTAGKRYLNEIYNLINSYARINENESAFIEISFQQVDNTDLFNYVISCAKKSLEKEEFLSLTLLSLELMPNIGQTLRSIFSKN